MRSAAGAGEFARLHEIALELIDRLHTAFDVVRNEAIGLDPELEQAAVARPTIALAPRGEDIAPLVVAFTPDPGLHVRFGRWCTREFSAASAFGEGFEKEKERFLWRVLQLVEGRFRETSVLVSGGYMILQHEFWARDGTCAGGQLKVNVAGSAPLVHEAALEWKPWLRRWH